MAVSLAFGKDSGSGDDEEVVDDPTVWRPLPTVIDDLTVTTRFGSLLGGDPEVTLEAEIADGAIYVAWRQDAETEGGHTLRLNITDVPIMSLGVVLNAVKAPLAGSIAWADATLVLTPDNRPTGNRVDIMFDNLARGPGWQEIDSAGLTLLTPLRAGRLWTVAEWDDGHINLTASNVTNPYADGPQAQTPPIAERDLDLSLEGRITPRDPFRDSRLTLQLGLADEFVDANDLQRPLDAIPMMSRACTANQCAFLLTGTAGRIQPAPWRRGGR